MRTILLLTLFIVADITAQNIMISNQNNPNEPSIIIDPKNPNVLIAGANLNNYYVSKDTGRTWKEYPLYSSFGVWGDPALAVDTAGNFFYFHLSNPSSGNWIDRIVCQKSNDTGTSWLNGSYTGLNGTKMQDKQWCAIDRATNNIYITWTQFDKYASTNPLDSSIILFSKSIDEGNTWSTPKRINKVAGDCLDDDNTAEGAVPAVGPNGEIYVAWAGPNGLVFNKSTDEGKTWLKKETIISPIPGGWNFFIPGINRANGLPVTVCDLSKGNHRGTIYVNWSDQRNGSGNTDIWLSKSTNGGKTWSTPKKVNDDNSSSHQFLTWMTIDQVTGNLYFVFYDRRNYNNDSTDVFIAYSKDGGNTIINRKISQSPFLPNPGIFFGDYTNITAHNGIVRPIWTRLNNGALSLWTDLSISHDTLLTSHITDVENIFDFENFPNPSINCTYISFKLHTSATINLTIVDLQGKIVSKILTDERREYGKYIERIDLDKLNIPSGLYFLKLQIDNEVKIIRQIKI